jgi:hypothetical protein
MQDDLLTLAALSAGFAGLPGAIRPLKFKAKSKRRKTDADHQRIAEAEARRQLRNQKRLRDMGRRG